MEDLVPLDVGVLEGLDDAVVDVPQRGRHLLRREERHLGGRRVRPELPGLAPIQQLAQAHEIRLQEKQTFIWEEFKTMLTEPLTQDLGTGNNVAGCLFAILKYMSNGSVRCIILYGVQK